MLRIGICDDQPEIIAQLEETLTHIACHKNIRIEIETFFDGSRLLNFYERGGRLDILYLDIEMEKVGGIDAARKIRDVDSNLIILFCSSHEGYMIELFEVEPFRFLKKPVQSKDVLDTFEKAYDKLLKHHAYFEYTFNKEFVRIPVHDIHYFESSGRKILIHTDEGIEEFYGKLSNIEENLEASSISFLRIHRSFLINFQKIKTLNYTKVKLQNGKEFPISGNRQKVIREQYLQLLGED